MNLSSLIDTLFSDLFRDKVLKRWIGIHSHLWQQSSENGVTQLNNTGMNEDNSYLNT